MFGVGPHFNIRMIILIFCSDTPFFKSFVLLHSLVLMSISPESTFTFPKSETAMFYRKAMARANVRSQFASNVFDVKTFFWLLKCFISFQDVISTISLSIFVLIFLS